MTAQLFHIEDYRPPVPGVAGLWLNACFHLWLGLVMAAMVPMAMLIRRQT